MRDQRWPSSGQTRQSSSGQHPEKETKETALLMHAHRVCMIPRVMSDLLSKHTMSGEIYGETRLTLRQFTTAAGWSGMAAV